MARRAPLVQRARSQALGLVSFARFRPEAVVAVALMGVALLVFFKLAAYIDRPIVDDAAISISFGRTLVEGDGLRLTPYSQVVEGYSNPTWTLVLGIFEKLHINAMRPAKTLGVVFAALVLPLVAAWGPLAQRRKLQVEDAVPALVVCSNPTFVYWGLGGLELGFFVFLVGLFGVFVFASPRRATAIGAGLTGAAVALTRPEGILYVGVGAIVLVLDRIFERRWSRRHVMIAVASLAIPLGAYLVFRLVYFGAPLPNTYYAKHSWYTDLPNMKVLRQQINDTAWRFVTVQAPLLIVAGIALVLSITGGLTIFNTAFVALVVSALSFVFYFVGKGDWMMEWRFLAPAIPFIGYPLAPAITGIRRLSQRRLGERRRLRIGVHVGLGIAAALALGWTFKANQARFKPLKELGSNVPLNPEDRPTYGNDLRDSIKPFGMTHPLIGGPDMGWLSMGLREAEIIDLAGLADVAIARHYNNWPAVHDYLVSEGYPTVLMVWGPSGFVSRMPDIIGKYRAGSGKYASYRLYTGATATADDRCPAGKPAALEDTRTQMIDNIKRELQGGNAVRALAFWRCYFTYRTDDALPTSSERSEIAELASEFARSAETSGNAELALRDYSLCAVVGASSFSSSVRCRLHAEKLRTQLFPRPQKRHR